ncbi:ImmA/IrrE family metallo-endopeptidase [Jannaschia seohaensis]|uniref:ImmA/IrrE family metallo-endopeptidase n=1 Tax=Jannaschia seohaensis TaxID=475081 RepID=UPI000D6CF389|nr:ImmA/IrrE family metallo-endopeptidase [Jannaschia seohaensis]
MTQAYHPPIPTRWPKAFVDDIGGRVAEQLGVTPGADLSSLVESMGGQIVYGPQYSDEYEGGAIVVRAFDDFTITLSNLTSGKRDRFTIAHELGHLALHYQPVLEAHGKVIMRATRDKTSLDADHERCEWEANWFAAGFLMPRDKFAEAAKKYTNASLATYFNVSGAAIDVRKKTLGIP